MNHFNKESKSSKATVEIKSFKPRALTGEVIQEYSQVKEKFGNLASTDPASNSHFSLHPAAKKNLGIEAEERGHLEARVQDEVEGRIAALRDEAVKAGFEEGRLEGKAQAEAEFLETVQPLYAQFNAFLAEMDASKQDIFNANERFLVQMVFQIAKQVTLEELKTSPEYVSRLASQILEKLGAKDNIRIKVSKSDSAVIDQLREHLKAQFQDLKNIQIEASDEVVLGGCKIETDLSQMNASVEAQFKAIQAALGDT